MREFRSYGSVRGALSNERPYREFRKQLPMTSFRQIEANRRNALKSTGPKTEAGKQQSRCNAVRHGLTAETVIGALEDAEDYQAFEATIIADYDAQSAVERELVLRLASLLWRLRRATVMETGLFEIQASICAATGMPVNCCRILATFSTPCSTGRGRTATTHMTFRPTAKIIWKRCPLSR
jgi:hypothetical protein